MHTFLSISYTSIASFRSFSRSLFFCPILIFPLWHSHSHSQAVRVFRSPAHPLVSHIKAFISFLFLSSFFNKTHTRHNDCEFIYSAFEILFEYFSIYFFLALINKCEFNSFSLTWVHTEMNTHSLLNCDAFLSFPTENQMVSRWLRYGLTCIKRIAHPQLYILYTIAHICRLLRFFVVA